MHSSQNSTLLHTHMHRPPKLRRSNWLRQTTCKTTNELQRPGLGLLRVRALARVSLLTYKIKSTLSHSKSPPPTPNLTSLCGMRGPSLLSVLTVPFEMCTESAIERKRHRYHGLLGDCRANGYSANPLTVEVGSRGFLHCRSFDGLCKFVPSKRCEQEALEEEIIRTCVQESYRVWCKRNCREAESQSWTMCTRDYYLFLFVFFFVLFLWTSPNTVQYYVLIFWQKHVLHINPSDEVFSWLWINYGDMFAQKKEKRERERQRTGCPWTHTRLPSGGAATRWRTWKSAKVTALAQRQRAKRRSSGLRKCLSDRLEISCKTRRAATSFS